MSRGGSLRVGGQFFYEKKAYVDELGFKAAIDIALRRGKIARANVDTLLIRFYLKGCGPDENLPLLVLESPRHRSFPAVLGP